MFTTLTSSLCVRDWRWDQTRALTTGSTPTVGSSRMRILGLWSRANVLYILYTLYTLYNTVHTVQTVQYCTHCYALHTVHTPHTVHTVLTVHTVHTVLTVHTVHTCGAEPQQRTASSSGPHWGRTLAWRPRAAPAAPAAPFASSPGRPQGVAGDVRSTGKSPGWWTPCRGRCPEACIPPGTPAGQWSGPRGLHWTQRPAPPPAPSCPGCRRGESSCHTRWGPAGRRWSLSSPSWRGHWGWSWLRSQQQPSLPSPRRSPSCLLV